MTETATPVETPVELIPIVPNDQWDQMVLNQEDMIPVIVDFFTPWCGPCKQLFPMLEKMAKKYEGRLKIVRINVDKNGHTAARYKVRGIPALLFFRKKEQSDLQATVRDLLIGFMPEEMLEEAIERFLE